MTGNSIPPDTAAPAPGQASMTELTSDKVTGYSVKEFGFNELPKRIPLCCSLFLSYFLGPTRGAIGSNFKLGGTLP